MHGLKKRMRLIAIASALVLVIIPDEFVRHASKEEEWAICGMDENSLLKNIEKFLENHKYSLSLQSF